MIRRLLNILGLVALLALLVVILINFSEPAWTWHTRWESKRLLAAAKTTNELTEAVGKLGCFLTFPDNSWMAIRYRDTHGGILASSAIVRDSGGTWFESTEHYCAAVRLGVVVHQKILEA